VETLEAGARPSIADEISRRCTLSCEAGITCHLAYVNLAPEVDHVGGGIVDIVYLWSSLLQKADAEGSRLSQVHEVLDEFYGEEVEHEEVLPPLC